MSNIPKEYQIDTLINQETYLVDGELKKWKGETTPVYSTISSSEKYAPTLLGSIPFMGEKEAIEAVDAADLAYNNGQGLWPTMKVVDRIKEVVGAKVIGFQRERAVTSYAQGNRVLLPQHLQVAV